MDKLTFDTSVIDCQEDLTFKSEAGFNSDESNLCCKGTAILRSVFEGPIDLLNVQTQEYLQL